MGPGSDVIWQTERREYDEMRVMLARRSLCCGCRELDDLQSGAIRKGIVEAGEGEDSPADGDLVSYWPWDQLLFSTPLRQKKPEQTRK